MGEALAGPLRTTGTDLLREEDCTWIGQGAGRCRARKSSRRRR